MKFKQSVSQLSSLLSVEWLDKYHTSPGICCGFIFKEKDTKQSKCVASYQSVRWIQKAWKGCRTISVLLCCDKRGYLFNNLLISFFFPYGGKCSSWNKSLILYFTVFQTFFFTFQTLELTFPRNHRHQYVDASPY